MSEGPWGVGSPYKTLLWRGTSQTRSPKWFKAGADAKSSPSFQQRGLLGRAGGRILRGLKNVEQSQKGCEGGRNAFFYGNIIALWGFTKFWERIWARAKGGLITKRQKSGTKKETPLGVMQSWLSVPWTLCFLALFMKHK